MKYDPGSEARPNGTLHDTGLKLKAQLHLAQERLC